MNLFFRTTALMLLLLSRAPLAAMPLPTVNLTDGRTSNTSQNQISSRSFKYSLSGLYAIESFNSDPIQPYTDFDVLYSKAHQAQFELESLCKSTAMLSGTHAFFSGIKSADRAKQKIELELNGNTNKITDLARATIIADDVEGLMAAYETLTREATVVKAKNRFKTPNKSGYRDLNVVVELPKTKLMVEVQLHLRAIADVKSGPEHDIYKVIQGLERTAVAQGRPLNDIETGKIAQLRNQAFDLYHQAWQPYISPQATAA